MQKFTNRPIAAVLALLFLLLTAQVGLAENKKVDINTATAAELTSLRGIGTAKSEAIVAYREKHGPFKTVNDLTAVRGIGDKLLEQLRPNITVGSAHTGGPTTKH